MVGHGSSGSLENWHELEVFRFWNNVYIVALKHQAYIFIGRARSITIIRIQLGIEGAYWNITIQQYNVDPSLPS